jgi:hypothetical protein
MTHISRVEPDPSLFQPPADFQIEDQSANRIQESNPLPPPVRKK